MISVSLQCHWWLVMLGEIGGLCSLVSFFGDWCVEEMWGGGHGVVILGIVVVMRVELKLAWCKCLTV